MTVLIADDHAIVRNGLKQIVNEINNLSIIDEAKDGNEAFNKIKSKNFDFVILDISMPGQSGLDILKALKTRKEKTNILILSIYPQAQYAIRALRLGASGYLSKDSAPEELELAIKIISEGRRYISSDIIGKLVSDIDQPSDIILHDCLSEREFQIMCLIAKGVSLIEIGKKLFISDKTASTYRKRMLEKMGLKTNSELILYAYKNNLIQ